MPVSWEGRTKCEAETITFPLVDGKPLLPGKRETLNSMKGSSGSALKTSSVKGTCNPGAWRRQERPVGYWAVSGR